MKRLNPALLTTALEERRTVNLAGVAAESLGRGGNGGVWFTPENRRLQDRQIDIRASRRMSVQLPARILYDDDRCSRDCMVTEISDWGCKIKVGGANELPEGFKLYDQSGEHKRSCRVIWRRTEEIGVEFIV